MPSVLLDAAFVHEADTEGAQVCADLVAHPWLCHYLKVAPGTHANVTLQVCTHSTMRYLDVSCTHLHFRYHSHCNYRHWDNISVGKEGPDDMFQHVGMWHSHENGALGPTAVNAAALARMLPLLVGVQPVALAAPDSSAPYSTPFGGSAGTGCTAMIAVNALDSTILFEVTVQMLPGGQAGGETLTPATTGATTGATAERATRVARARATGRGTMTAIRGPVASAEPHRCSRGGRGGWPLREQPAHGPNFL